MWPDVIGAIWFLDTRREDESPARRTHAAVAERQAGSDWFARLRVKLDGFRSVAIKSGNYVNTPVPTDSFPTYRERLHRA
jgi:hypothetical protein